MKIECIHIDGFGSLRGLDITLTSGINLFVGENEAGKSTLQQAVLALLFGFYHGTRAARGEREEHGRFRPWQGGAYGGSLDYVLDSGQRIRLRRSFDTDDVPTSVTDLGTGRDITRELGIGRHGNVPVDIAHLGMGREVFRSTCFVDQAAVANIGAPGAVAEAVVSIADTATVDVSAALAIARLEEALSEQVGGPKARVKPLYRARERLQNARERLQSLERDQATTRDGVARKDKLEQEYQGLRKQQRLISYLKISRRLQEVEGTLDTLRGVDRELAGLEKEAEGLRDYAAFPSEMRDTALGAKGRLDDLLQQRDSFRERWGEVSSGFEALQAEIRQCREEVDGLEYVRAFPLEKEELFNRLRFPLEDASAKLISLRRELGEWRDREEAGRRPRRRYRAISAGGAVLALILGISSAFAGFGSVGIPLAAVVALASLAGYLRFRSAPGSPRLEEVQRLVQGEETHVSQLEQQLEGLLWETGIEADSLKAGIDIFQKRIAGSRKLAQMEHHLRVLEEKRNSLLSMKRQWEDSENQAEEAKVVLLDVLRRAGIEAREVEYGVEQFEERHNKRRRCDVLQQRVYSLKDQRRMLLGGQTEAMLQTQRADLKAQEIAALAAGPDISGAMAERSASELETREVQLGQQLSRIDQEVARIDATVETILLQHRPRSEIEEDIARYEAEVRKLESFGSALSLAKDVLQMSAEEVHRDFAPRLAQSLGQTLSLITQGRYDSAYVDPKDLSIRVKTPETRDIVDAGKLSLGTREQAYLVLRIELARMLSANHESLPLLLDDPFVNFDYRRLPRTLSLLVDISRENQVVLFTRDPFVLQWFRSNCTEGTVFKVHELPPPVSDQPG